MKTRINIATSNGYILDNGKLTAYEFKSAKVDFATGAVEYDCILGGKPTSFMVEDGNCPNVYANETAYAQGNATMGTEYTFAKAVSSSLFAVREGVNEDGVVSAYRVENGAPVKATLPLSGYTLMSRGIWRYEGAEKFYKTRDEAMLHCDIIKVEADGTEIVCPSPASLVALDEEQMVALKAVEDALKQARKLGVAFGYDISDDEMFAYSDRHVEEKTWDYDGEIITAYGGYCINDLVTPMDAVSFSSFSRCDAQMYVHFKPIAKF